VLFFSTMARYLDLNNLIYFGAGPQRGPDRVLAITYPIDDQKLAGIAVEDIDKCAYGISRAAGFSVVKAFAGEEGRSLYQQG
jgi:hypothetical protein